MFGTGTRPQHCCLWLLLDSRAPIHTRSTCCPVCLQDRDAVRKQNATVQEPHTSHFKLTQQALVQSGGRILNPLEITQVGRHIGC